MTHAQRRAQGDAAAPAFAGDQLVEVRSYVYKDDAGEVEVPGAQCQLSAADFKADMTTPAKVRVPLYRGQSSTLAVACEMPGYKRSMIAVAPMDVTRQGRLASGVGAALLGVVAVAAIDAMSDSSQNDWRYPLARVVLDKEAPSRVSAAQ